MCLIKEEEGEEEEEEEDEDEEFGKTFVNLTPLTRI